MKEKLPTKSGKKRTVKKTVTRKKPETPLGKTIKELAEGPRTSSNAPRLRMEPLQIDTSAHKFDLVQKEQPHAPEPPAYEFLGDLPWSYGSKKLFLTARDPQYVYAYWDLSWEQFQEAEHAAHDRKVFLQIYHEGGDRVQQTQIYSGHRDWYAHVGEPDTTFYAELGYYGNDHHFHVLSRSGKTTTPRDNVSWKTHADFVTIPFEYTFQQLWDLIRAHLLPGEELAEALARLEAAGHQFPFKTFLSRGLSEEAHKNLLDYIGGDILRRIKVGSIEITELLKRYMTDLQSSGQWMSSMSSPFGASFGATRSREFFMHLNAELIIYGGTDPKAKVKIDGQEIRLREDGTFSYHFNFRDGHYFIPISAESSDGEETRSAMLSFMRITDKTEGVEATGQEPRPEPLGRKE
jgi:hypothetical protein